MSASKNSILHKSRELFERFGYQKTTLTDIAKSVGKVKTAIYYYFSGKEEIFAELVEVEAEEFLNNLIQEVEKEKNPQKKLISYVNTRVDLMEKIAKRYSFLKSEFFELMPIVEANRLKADEREVQFVSSILSSKEIQDEFNISKPEFTAKLLMQNLKGLEVQMYVTDQAAAHQENREAFVDFIIYGALKK
jgi:AcrR family transcriptional regulator